MSGLDLRAYVRSGLGRGRIGFEGLGYSGVSYNAFGASQNKGPQIWLITDGDATLKKMSLVI